MPRKKGYARKNKRGYRKRKRYNRPYKKTINQATGVPDVLRTKLKYSEQILLQPGPIGFGAQIMCGNSVYDPDVSGVGHQPRGYDQWSQFYKKYRVYASAIKVHYMSDQQAAAGLTNVWILPTPELPTTVSYGISSLNENPYAKTSMLVPYVGRGSTFLKHYMSTKKMFGEKLINEDGYEGKTGNLGTGSDPINKWYWTVGGETVTGSDLKVHMTITMTYYVEFFDRISLPTS